MTGYKFTQKLSAQRVADMMCSAIEGGCNYWCNGIFLTSPEPLRHENDSPYPWYCSRTLYDAPNFELEVHEIDEDDFDGLKIKKYKITRENFEKGIAIMAEKYPGHMADIRSENDDATTADVFLQCVVFGEIVYG